ncbi:type II secretion system protein GspC [Alkalilimnicola ehrlichii]|nr:type II secretion system protein GspC [Alkalilimnicola ehrlichii]
MKYSIATLNQALQPQVLDRLALAAAVLLVILLGHGLANFTWSVIPQSREAAPPPQPIAASATEQRPAGNDYRRLASISLFGEASPDDVATAPIEAPDTRLNLTLRGILFNSNPDQARAIIAAPGRADEHYRVGQEISRGVQIDRILADRVILRRDGQYETLRLPEDRLDDVASAPPTPRQPSRAQSRSPSQASTADTQDLNRYRRELLERPDQAQRYLRAEPVNTDSGMQGFRIQPGSDARLFEMAGLEPGDVVTAINDVQLDQMDKAFLALEELAGSGDITLRVNRGGREQTVRIQF